MYAQEREVCDRFTVTVMDHLVKQYLEELKCLNGCPLLKATITNKFGNKHDIII